MAALQIEYRSPVALRPRERNPRTHSKRQLRQIADSIRMFGFTNPILVDDSGTGIVAGHGRVAAAKILGMAEVPTVRLPAMSDAEVRAYVLADNKLAENAGWDRRLLALELQYLTELEIDIGFDATVTGFETAEIDLLIGSLDSGTDSMAEEVPDIDREAPPASRPGDLWRIGPHRLLYGDALKPESYERLLDGKRAQLVFTDPPYNVPVDGHVCGLGKVKHREFAMAAGEMSEAEFTAFLRAVFANLVAHSTDGSLHFVCMDWRHIGEVLAAAKGTYAELKNLCVWNKTNAGMGSFYRSKHELVFVFKNGTSPHVNNVELGRHGRHRTNVWDYAGVNTLKAERDAELAMHPTVKPVAMVADAILDGSKRNGLVLDPFAGSGTTLIAAHRTGRRGCGIELDPRYADLIVRRLEEATGLTAVHAETEETVDATRAARAAALEETTP